MSIAITMTVAAVLTLTDADLVPGALVTVWEDDAGRHVLVEPLGEDDGTDEPALAEVR